MASSSENDSRRRKNAFAQEYKEDEINWSSDQDDEPKNTVGKIEKISSSGDRWNGIPEARRRALATSQKYKSKEDRSKLEDVEPKNTVGSKWSKLEDVEPKNTVGKIKKLLHEVLPCSGRSHRPAAGSSRSYMDIPDERPISIAQRLKKEENGRNDEDDGSEKTVGKNKKSASDDNNFPEIRRKATSQRLRQKVKFSSSDDELELNITVGKIKKATIHRSRKRTNNITADTSNSVQDIQESKQLQKLATKMDNLIILVESMSEKMKRLEHVLCQVAEKNDIHHNLGNSSEGSNIP